MNLVLHFCCCCHCCFFLGYEESLKYKGVSVLDSVSAVDVFNDFLKGHSKYKNLCDLTLLDKAVTMEKLAELYQKTESPEEALRCYSFCLPVYVACHGDQSFKVAVVLDRVGRLDYETGNLTEGVRLLQRSIQIRETASDDKPMSKDDAIVHMDIGKSLLSMGGNDEDVLRHLNSAVAIIEELRSQAAVRFSTSSINTELKFSENISSGYWSNLLLECYTSILYLMQKETSGSVEDKEEVAEVIHHVGNLQASLQQYNGAIDSFLEVLKFHRNFHGDNHLSVADLLFNLGNIYLETSNIEKSRECHEECHRITVQVLGEDSIELAENMVCLGHVEFRSKNYMVAINWYDKVLLKVKRELSEVTVATVLHRKVSDTLL